MSGTAFSTGQLTELQNIFTPSLAKALPTVAAKFGDPKRVLNALQNKGEILAQRLETMSLEEVIKSFLILIYRGRITIIINETRDPNEWYRTRPSLDVWNGFRDHIASKVKPVVVGTTYTIDVWELGEDLTDEQVEAALPTNHFFEESAVSAILAEAISQQAEGKAGHLMNTGKENLLYTGSCVVDALWHGGDREWNVYAWRRHGGGWDAGDLVFSPAN